MIRRRDSRPAKLAGLLCIGYFLGEGNAMRSERRRREGKSISNLI